MMPMRERRGMSVAACVALLKSPGFQADLMMILKSVAAAVLAWVVAADLFGLGQSFLAPWTALLTVHATVFRTLSRGIQSVVASGVGVVLAFLVALALGTDVAAVAVALLVGLVIARMGLLRAEGITVATTALFVLVTGDADNPLTLLGRLLDTSIGVAAGVLINVVIVPPLHNRSAQQRVDEINRKLGGLLMSMAEQLRSSHEEERSRSWIERTREIDDDLDGAWQAVRTAHESTRFNPRYRFSRRISHPSNYREVLHRLEDGIAHTRAIAQVVDESIRTSRDWDPRFRGPWLDLVTETGRRVADPDADVGALLTSVNDLTRELSTADLPDLLWPAYGALISNLTNIIDIVDDVASSRPVRA